jgi:uncharacterized membrane protein YkvA (DUF1232 family)
MNGDKWKERAARLKTETYALYLAARHPGTPWYAKLLAVAIVGYALSPIDLIPDFIPVLGLLDDLVIVPVGLAICVKMVPRDVIYECRESAAGTVVGSTRAARVAAVVVIVVWLMLLGLLTFLFVRACS